MNNQPTAPVPITDLTPDQATKYLILSVIPSLEGTIMALTDAVNRLTNEVATQMQQTADALAGVQTALNDLQVSEQEKADLQAALDEAVSTNASATEAINAQADVLASDNPEEEPETPTEPEVPEEPTEP